jgi:hypothetical protein
LASPTEYSEIAKKLHPLLPLEAKKAATSTVEIGQAVNTLMKLGDIGKWFDSFELQQQLSSLVFEVWSATQAPADRQALLDQKLSRFVSSLRLRIGSWRVVVPLQNLAIPNRRKIRIGKVDFFLFSKNRGKRTLEQIRASLKRNPNYANDDKFIANYLGRMEKDVVGDLVGNTCAETEVYGRVDNACEEALPKIEEAIAAVKFFHYLNDDFYGRYFGIVGRVISQVRRVMLVYPKVATSVGFESAWVGARSKYEIDADRLKFMQKFGFSELNQILAKDNRTHVQERTISAILWFAKAVDVVLSDSVKVKPDPIFDLGRRAGRKPQAEMMGPYDRLVKLMVSLETLLLVDENEPIAANLSERVAMLVVRGYQERKAHVQFVKDMYRKRSGIIHHGGKDITENELKQLTFLTQQVIVAFLKNSRRWKLDSKESLQEWFLKQKLG